MALGRKGRSEFDGAHLWDGRSAMAAGEVKHPSAIHCGAATTVAEALGLIRGSDVDCLVVVECGRMVGVVTEHELTHRRPGERLGPADSIALALTRDTVYLRPERNP